MLYGLDKQKSIHNNRHDPAKKYKTSKSNHQRQAKPNAKANLNCDPKLKGCLKPHTLGFFCTFY